MANTSSSPVVGTFSVVPTAIGCSGTAGAFSITVNPTPNVNSIPSQVKCNGVNSEAINFSGLVSGTTYAWTNNQSSIGILGSGSGNISSIALANTSNSPVVGTFSVEPTANGCSGTTGAFNITVNPTPTVNSITSQVKCNGVNSDAISFSGLVTGTTYAWTNTQSSIGIGSTGSGNISSVALSNATSSPAIGTFSVVPSANGCSGTAGAFNITVNPTPTLNSITSQVKCNGVNSDAISFSGLVTGTTYAWTNTQSSIGILGSGNGNISSIALANTSSSPVVGTFLVVPKANGCNGTSSSFSITVNPLPAAPTANSVTTNYNGLEQTTPDLILPAGQSISWFNSSVGGVSSTKPKGKNADTYNSYASATIDATGCISSSRTLIYLTINKAPLTITAKDATRTYGTVNPTLSFIYSGLVNEENEIYKWPDINTIAVPNSPPGTYPIIPSAAVDPNYTISYFNGSLTVTKAPLTITAKPHTITYNGTAYTGGNGVVPTGLAAGESISSLTGTLIYTGTSQGAKNVDTYTIIPGGLSSPNYNINYVGATLEIKKATLKVIAGDQSVNFGTPAAKILTDATFTYASLLGGDDASAITGSVTYSTNYTPLTSTGASGIYLEPIITGLSSTNYDIIAVKGTITITAPPSSPVFQIPNAFTPNSDGHNDTFKIIENGYVTSIIGFKIFTKSGKLIFSDKDGAWDGRFAGVMLDSDVYIWIADFMNKNNVQEHLSGTVLLLK